MPYLGAKLAPIEAWLLIRGLRTLPLRMRRHHESGLAVAERLAGAPARHAGAPPAALEPGRCRPLAGCSSLFAFELAPTRSTSRAFATRCELFQLGVSWGGHESLVFPALAGLGQSGGPNALRDFGVSAAAGPPARRARGARRPDGRSRAGARRRRRPSNREEADMTALLTTALALGAMALGRRRRGPRPRCSSSR